MEKQIRRSSKRDAIYAELCKSKQHPSAESVYASLKTEYSDLSLGTVYRNLSIFKEEGRIMTVGVVDGKERFDADLSPHHHFICRKCGAVLDVYRPITIDNEPIRHELRGAKLESVNVVFHGVCINCVNVENNNIK